MISAQYVDGLELRIKELLERIAHHERTNAEQAAMLNKVIEERDKAVDILRHMVASAAAERCGLRIADDFLAKYSPAEDPVEEARRKT